MPVEMTNFPLVSTAKGIFAVGGDEYPNGRKNEILQLICPEGQEVSDCQWNEFPQKLKFVRDDPVVIPLPASYELCNN